MASPGRSRVAPERRARILAWLGTSSVGPAVVAAGLANEPTDGPPVTPTAAEWAAWLAVAEADRRAR